MHPDPHPDPGPGDERGLAAVLLCTAREALGVAQGELAAAAGCDEALIRRIEAGDLDVTLDTLERILNESGLELRAEPQRPDGRHTGPHADRREAARVRSALSEARAFRHELGAPPPGPPAGALPDWDGEDPAPGRPFGAAEGRRDGGGRAAGLMRLARVAARATPSRFAQACDIAEPHLARVESGEARPTVGKLAAMLARAGTGLRVRLEVYDDHDDGLHLSAPADPELHRPRPHARRAAPHIAASV